MIVTEDGGAAASRVPWIRTRPPSATMVISVAILVIAVMAVNSVVIVVISVCSRDFRNEMPHPARVAGLQARGSATVAVLYCVCRDAARVDALIPSSSSIVITREKRMVAFSSAASPACPSSLAKAHSSSG